MFANACSMWYNVCMKLLLRDIALYGENAGWKGDAYMYHVECIDIHKTDKMYLYIGTGACLCANNMYNVANFHIRNLMTGLKKDISLAIRN